MVQTHKVADQREFANVLYYGDGGTGKTSALASMANLGRVMYIDAESGIKLRPLKLLGINVDNIELPDLEGPLNHDALDDIFWSMKSDLDADPDSWFGCVLDSGSEIARAFLDDIVGKRVTKAEKLGSKASEMMKDPFFIDLDNWGYMSQQFRDLIRRFRDLDCHFGISFLERRDKEKDGSVRVGPAINPGLQTDVVGWHDVVCRTSTEGGIFLGATQPEGIRIGKDRYGALPHAMVNPSFARMLGYIHDELQEETDPLQNVTPTPAASDDEEEGPNATTTDKALTPLERAKAATAARKKKSA